MWASLVANFLGFGYGGGILEYDMSKILVSLNCLLTLTKKPFPTKFAKKSTKNSVMSLEGYYVPK